MLITTSIITMTKNYTHDRIKELEEMKSSFVDCHGRYVCDYGSVISDSIDEEISILKEAISNPLLKNCNI